MQQPALQVTGPGRRVLRTAVCLLVLSLALGQCGRGFVSSATTETGTQLLGSSSGPAAHVTLVSGPAMNAAPDFRLRNQDDRLVSLSDFRGHYVHLDFSAIWCGPCRFQARYLRRLEQELEPYGFVSMTVMVTRSPADAKRWAREYRLRNVLADLEGEARGRFEAFSYPTNVIVRPDGSVAGRWTGASRDAASFQRQLRRVVPEMFRERDNNNNNESAVPKPGLI